MLEIYQHLPEHISPITLKIGFLSIRWYAISYLVGFIVVYLLLRWRIKRDNSRIKIPNQISIHQPGDKSQIIKLIDSFFIYAIVGLLIGARLGYVLFYNFSYFFRNPLAIVSPYDFSAGIYTGISGMSYFGGLIGIAIAAYLFIRRRKLDFWQWADFVIPAIPAGYFFGRIGNFLNGELYGRATAKFWGMYFPGGGGVLRHPSQLYEAIGEGIILFVILWNLRNSSKFPGYLFSFYFFGYGILRFGIEFFREPDGQASVFFGFLTLGQIFSLGLMIFSLFSYFWQKRKKMLG